MKNIVNGALLMCTGGTVPTPLTVTSQFIMKSDGNLVATKLDSSPFVNIKPFGVCSPQSGKYPHPCNLCLVGTWLGANETVLVNGAAALLQGSKIPCAFGMISIIQPGQFTMMMGQVIPPISLNPIRIESLDISLDINQEENESSEDTTENTNANENNNSTEVDNNGEINEENESNEVDENRTYKAHLKVEYEDRLKPVNMSYKVYDSGDNLIREGVLDDNGEAFLEGLLSENIKVEYGEDERDEPIEDELALSPIFEYRGKVDKNFIESGFSRVEEIKAEKNLKISELPSSLEITWIWKNIGNNQTNNRRIVDVFLDISLFSFEKDEYIQYADILLSSLLYLSNKKRDDRGEKKAWLNIAILTIFLDVDTSEAEKYILALTSQEEEIKKVDIYPRIRRLTRMNPETFINNLINKDLTNLAKNNLERYINYFKEINSYLPGNLCNKMDDLFGTFRTLVNESSNKMEIPINELKEELRAIVGEEGIYSVGKQFVEVKEEEE